MHSHHTSFSDVRARALAKGFSAGQLDTVYQNSRNAAGRALSNASEYARNYVTELLAISALFPPDPAYLAFNPLRLGAAKPAAEFSRYHDACRELENMLRTEIRDLEDLLVGFVEHYDKMEEELEKVSKENESMKSMIDSTLYDA